MIVSIILRLVIISDLSWLKSKLLLSFLFSSECRLDPTNYILKEPLLSLLFLSFMLRAQHMFTILISFGLPARLTFSSKWLWFTYSLLWGYFFFFLILDSFLNLSDGSSMASFTQASFFHFLQWIMIIHIHGQLLLFLIHFIIYYIFVS